MSPGIFTYTKSCGSSDDGRSCLGRMSLRMKFNMQSFASPFCCGARHLRLQQSDRQPKTRDAQQRHSLSASSTQISLSPVISAVISTYGQVPAKSFHEGRGAVVIGHGASRCLDAHANPIAAGFGDDCLADRVQHAA
jgi:hypothetical protein